MEAGATQFLDNVNSTALKSDVLASAITERPAAVRPLGRSATVLLNATAFVSVIGTGRDDSRAMILISSGILTGTVGCNHWAWQSAASSRATRPA